MSFVSHVLWWQSHSFSRQTGTNGYSLNGTWFMVPKVDLIEFSPPQCTWHISQHTFDSLASLAWWCLGLGALETFNHTPKVQSMNRTGKSKAPWLLWCWGPHNGLLSGISPFIWSSTQRFSPRGPEKPFSTCHGHFFTSKKHQASILGPCLNTRNSSNVVKVKRGFHNKKWIYRYDCLPT